MEAYDLCVEADGMHKGSALLLKACSETRSQLFIFAGNSIRLSNDHQNDLCLRSLQEKDFLRALPVTSGERCLWRVVEVLSAHLQDGHQSSRIPGIATNTTDPTIPSTHAANGLNDANRAVSNTINRLLGRGGLLAHDPTEKR